MNFELLPILDLMLDFYEKPRDFDRFQAYLSLLQGDTKGDLTLPIGGFNPMAKPHVLDKLRELKALEVEKIMTETLAAAFPKQKNAPVFKVALTLADDAQGGWTNRFTTDFDSKFKINALVNRQFCTPVFWTSDDYSTTVIQETTMEYAFRTVYWHNKKTRPQTLKGHLEQEQFVAKNVAHKSPKPDCDVPSLRRFYETYADSDDYALIFNFFYGDAASESLGFKTFGTKNAMTGFNFSR